MRGAANDSAKMDGPGQLRMKWVGNIVLLEFTGTPAGDAEETIVEGEIDVRDQRWNGLKSFQQRRQTFRAGPFRGDFDHFVGRPISVLAMPEPNG